MNFQAFRTTFRNYPVLSTREIEKLYPNYDAKNLVYWQKKGYIQKIRNGWYRLEEKTMDSDTLYFTANHIYSPSYISLEMALSYYGFIPDGVFKITSISTLKTQEFTTPIGVFSYSNIKPTLFSGYKLVYFGDFCFKIAEPEKAILDYLYFHSDIHTEDHFFELRWNVIEITNQIKLDVLHDYQVLANHKSLSQRINMFLKYLENA